MRLTCALPPQFLLPAWGTRKAYKGLQDAHRAIQLPSVQRCAYASDSKPPVKKDKPALSLFEELFPEERKKREDLEREKKLEKLPPFKWDERLEAVLEDRNVPKKAPVEHQWQIPTKSDNSAIPKKQHQAVRTPVTDNPRKDRQAELRREASVLILNCASKTLEESDFFRVSPKGEHIEGWTGGILKVIPARDANTLEHESTYFILFSSEPAARAYLDQTIRLHELSRSHQGSLAAATLPPPNRDPRDGEDLKSTLDDFTLVPGYNRLFMRHALRPYKPTMLQLLENGGTKTLVNMEQKGEGIVLFSVDNGQLSQHDIRNAIKEDGIRRNLHWEIELEGISGLPSNRMNDVDDKMFGHLFAEGAGEMELADGQRRFRAPSRYVLSFKYKNEARRFVREWHRRPLPMRGTAEPGDEPPPIVDAEIIW